MSSIRLSVYVVVVFCILMGCNSVAEQKKTVLWDLSKGHRVTNLSGGQWTPRERGLSDASYVYYVTGSRELSLSIRLTNDRRFEFHNVNRVGVQKRGDEIELIKVASYGYSQEEAIKRLKQMHAQWHGAGVRNVQKWLDETAKGSLDTYRTAIDLGPEPGQPEIFASIMYNFGGPVNRWYIMVEFYWPRDESNKRSKQ